MIRAYMPKPTSQLQEFARIGAAARIKELQAEIASIRRDFPALTAPGAPKKRRRKMSAAARKKISEAQKKRWAAQKAKE
jgi:hypothetical protein